MSQHSEIPSLAQSGASLQSLVAGGHVVSAWTGWHKRVRVLRSWVAHRCTQRGVCGRCRHVGVPRDGLHTSVNAKEGTRCRVCMGVCKAGRVVNGCACAHG